MVYAHKGMLFSLKKEILSHAITWMNLEDVTPSKISQRQKKTNTPWFHLYDLSRVDRFIETESRIVVARGWGRGVV